jgi:hypothetical protein
MLLNALDGAIQQASGGGQGAEIASLAAKEKELQASLNAKGDPAEISRQAIGLLATLYPPPKPSAPAHPSDPPLTPVPKQNDYLLIAILVSLISPLICIAGFWWGAKVTDNKLRKGLREAGLL